MLIELSDVTLCASPRGEADWEEGPASAREQAAKQAQLAAAELEKLSRRLAQEKGAGTGTGWSFLSHLGTLLLKKLQLSVNNVHIYFRETPLAPIGTVDAASTPASDAAAAAAGAQFGVRLASLRTLDGSSAAGSDGGRSTTSPDKSAAQPPLLSKDIAVEQLSFYWVSGAESAEDGAGWTTPGLTRRASILRGEDILLKPLDCILRLSSPSGIAAQPGDSETRHLDVAAEVGQLDLQVQRCQLMSMLQALDSAAVWMLRNRHAKHRPAGWRSDPAAKVPWK